MDFSRGIGIISGFVTGYIIITGLLYFVLSIFSAMPEGWDALHIATLTMIIILFGSLLEGWLQ